MQLHNIQENLAKTQILQRLQSIQQDATRVAQAHQTPAREKRGVQMREQVQDTHQPEQPIVHERQERRRARRRGRKEKEKEEGKAETEEEKKAEARRRRRPPDADGGGAVIDVRV